MPIIKIEQINSEVSWCIWKIEEPVDSLLQSTRLSNQELLEFQRYNHLKRKLEWLGARSALNYLLCELGHDYSGIEKDEFDKPMLLNQAFHISLAHSYPFAVAMVHKSRTCGIDIEKTKRALIQVSPRFLSEQEMKNIKQNLEGLCLAWTAKESLFKMYGKIPLSFKNQMFLYPFQVKNQGILKASVNLTDQREEHLLAYRRIDDFFICFNY